MRIYNPATKKIHWHTTVKFLKNWSNEKLLKNDAIDEKISWDRDDVDDDDDEKNEKNQKKTKCFCVSTDLEVFEIINSWIKKNSWVNEKWFFH